jgi:hypothetical protein
MATFEIVLKEKRGDIPAGTKLRVSTPLSSCDPDKIRDAIKKAGFKNLDATYPGYWDIKKV